MIDSLTPLAELPGVRLVLLATRDGVPVCVPGRLVSDDPDAHDAGGPLGEHALAAVAADWLDETARAVAPLGFAPPERVALRAARGTLVLQRAEDAVIAVLLGDGLRPEDVRLALEGTALRIQRHRRDGLGRNDEAESENRNVDERNEPPGPLPARDASPDREAAR